MNLFMPSIPVVNFEELIDRIKDKYGFTECDRLPFYKFILNMQDYFVDEYHAFYRIPDQDDEFHCLDEFQKYMLGVLVEDSCLQWGDKILLCTPNGFSKWFDECCAIECFEEYPGYDI